MSSFRYSFAVTFFVGVHSFEKLIQHRETNETSTHEITKQFVIADRYRQRFRYLSLNLPFALTRTQLIQANLLQNSLSHTECKKCVVFFFLLSCAHQNAETSGPSKVYSATVFVWCTECCLGSREAKYTEYAMSVRLTRLFISRIFVWMVCMCRRGGLLSVLRSKNLNGCCCVQPETHQTFSSQQAHELDVCIKHLAEETKTAADFDSSKACCFAGKIVSHLHDMTDAL